MKNRDVVVTSRPVSYAVLAGFLAVTFSVAGLAARFAPGEWYLSLDKPPWTPPDAVFPPVWTLLYAFMAVAAWLVWRTRSATGVPLALWAVQLVLNGAWSWIFFGMHEPLWALLELVLLWVVVATTVVLFWRAVRPAGVLMGIYLGWLSYAAALNGAIVVLNEL